MILLLFFVSVYVSCLPLLQSVIGENVSTPICPESFWCPDLPSFKYPFYNVTDTRCGLIKVDCTSKGGKIQLGGGSYEIAGNTNTCEALMNDLTPPSPSPLLYSISILPSITLFKCPNNPNYVQQQTDAYFYPHGYKSYLTCKDYVFYYNYSNGTVPNNLPHACQVVHLPVNLPSAPGLDEDDIFSLLSSFPSFSFKLSPSCNKCYKKDRGCDTENGKVYCYDIKVIAGSVLILTTAFVIFMIWRHCKNNPFSYVLSKNKSAHLEDISVSCGVSVFSYKELEDATQNFDPSHELGDGGFGAVYYGKLHDGREVAVKKLHEHNYNKVQQFINEVEILTKLRHPNLVVLYGFTSRRSSDLLLVYEYVSNGTVADHLHGELANPNLLTWPIRMNIAIETASALVYLHASEIIHRDVKTNNILLDHNLCVKVADFGLSRPQDEISLANLALNRIQKSAIDQLIDPVLGYDTNPEIMNMITSVAELAFRCLQYDSEMRPTMNEVLDVLMDIQAMDRIGAYDSLNDPRTVNELPLSKINDAVILLKDFHRSHL
ncbi:hypothetical protein SSX86_015948 [Deinandra increscens subsp. villosa]|uniref:Protein kinase domain-containing protein n=1 Tax=Deinandra increscens subsp. villosa TaxID=3103831 RepID=A0AAP0CYQ3_9ASTR